MQWRGLPWWRAAGEVSRVTKGRQGYGIIRLHAHVLKQIACNPKANKAALDLVV